MKFTKEEAVEKLNQMLTNDGKKPLRMSAKTLESQTETLMALISDEEMELDAFVEKARPALESVNSNIEHDNSDFIRKYEKEHPSPTKPTPPEPPVDPNDPNAVLAARIKALEDERNARSEKEAVELKRAEIKKYLADNNVKDAKWIDSVLGIATIGKDDDAEERGKTFLGLYNQSLSGGFPITPGTPSPGSGVDKDAFAEVKAIRKRREEIGM